MFPGNGSSWLSSGSKNTERLARLAQCRNLQDLAAVQTELARENLHEMIDNSRRIAQRSMEVASEAARTITAETGKAARWAA